MQKEKKEIHVTMFNKFTVSVEQKNIYHGTERTSNMIRILQYLLFHHERVVSQSELIAECLGDDTENEGVVLKNLIYRLRKIFQNQAECDLILFKNGGYGINKEYCIVKLDVDLFDSANMILMQTSFTQDQKEQLYLMLDLFVEGFLPKYSSLLWVIKQQVLYEKIAIQICEALYRESGSNEELQVLLPYIAKICGTSPYEETLRYFQIQILHKIGRTNEALWAYEEFSKLLFDELCVEPSEEMKKVYHELLAVMRPSALPIREVKNLVFLGDEMSGALYCPQEVFVQLAHLSTRQAKRSGQSIMLMLCTLTEKDGSQPIMGERLRYMADQLRDTINEVCRIGDAFTRNSPSQFVVLLLGANLDNWEMIAERIRGNYFKKKDLKSTRLVCECISAIDLDQVIH